MNFISLKFRSSYYRYMLLLSCLTISFLLFNYSIIIYAQNESPLDNSSTLKDFQVINTENNEQFIFPYTASNTDRKNPAIYTYDTPKGINWILTIQNNMTYSDSPDAKTIIKLMEPKPSDKFIELALFEKDHKFWVAVNTNESGYIRVHEMDKNGWSLEQPMTVSHANNQGLSVTNGQRIVIDRLSLDGFNLGSITVYGKDNIDSPTNTVGGFITFDLLFGNPRDSPIYFLPIIMLIVVGAVIFSLLKLKKRDTDNDNDN